MSKKIIVTLPDGTYDIIKKMNWLGNTDGEKGKSIIISWLSYIPLPFKKNQSETEKITHVSNQPQEKPKTEPLNIIEKPKKKGFSLFRKRK